MPELPMRGHFRYLRFKTFPMTPRTLQCEVFCPFLSSSEHSGVAEDSQPPTFPSVGLHPHTWPKWGCDNQSLCHPAPTLPPVYLFASCWLLLRKAGRRRTSSPTYVSCSSSICLLCACVCVCVCVYYYSSFSNLIVLLRR
jgi:hypothetical protein